jgi:hypothetical protein
MSTRMARLAVAAGLALVLVGCGSTCPRHDDRGWRELTTTHFRLRTDRDEAEARRVLEELETMRAALLNSFRAPADIDTGQVAVVALGEGWGTLAGPLIDGVFSRPVFTPTVAIRAGSSVVGQTVVTHELVHFLDHHVHPAEPAWVGEGLATYFETLEITGPSGARQATVGRPEPGLVAAVQRGHLMSVADLRAGTAAHDSRSPFYPSAWLAIHYLMNHRPEALRSY